MKKSVVQLFKWQIYVYSGLMCSSTVCKFILIHSYLYSLYLYSTFIYTCCVQINTLVSCSFLRCTCGFRPITRFRSSKHFPSKYHPYHNNWRTHVELPPCLTDVNLLHAVSQSVCPPGATFPQDWTLLRQHHRPKKKWAVAARRTLKKPQMSVSYGALRGLRHAATEEDVYICHTLTGQIIGYSY